MRRSAVLIKGQVQGVFYRAHAVDVARGRDLRGWVRNLSNGDVEALVEGPDEAVQAFVAWAYDGSPAAYVEEVFVTEQPYVGDLGDFEIRD
jgi:acylphosphatase